MQKVPKDYVVVTYEAGRVADPDIHHSYDRALQVFDALQNTHPEHHYEIEDLETYHARR